MRHLGFWVAALALTAALAGCGQSGGGSKEAATETTAPAATPAEPTAAEKQAALAALPAPYNTGDLENGKVKFGLCRSCHTITPNGPNLTGPNLYGVFGRKAGTYAGFNYSDAVKTAGFTWDAQHLDQWLTNPRTFLPGTKMTFMGLKDAKDRVDLIAFLKVESGYKPQ
jgi:cytochrome c